MKLTHFFIDRPVFAGVLSMLVLIAGAVSALVLPISEYPEVAPPTIVVTAQYPGANPEVIAETVSSPLEQEITGVEDMIYMNSMAQQDGTLQLSVVFRQGTDVDRAQVQVQNRVSQALPRLPEEVRNYGVTTRKSSPDLTMVVHLFSPDQRYDGLYLRNYALLHVRDALARLPGAGDVQLFGAGDYAMRLWLDPQKLAARNLTAGDVIDAVREQNIQVAAGSIGGQPISDSVQFQLAINAQGRLRSEQDFRDIVIKIGADGEVVRLGEVATRPDGGRRVRAAKPARQSIGGRGAGISAAGIECVGSRAERACNHGHAQGELSRKESTTRSSTTRLYSSESRFIR